MRTVAAIILSTAIGAIAYALIVTIGSHSGTATVLRLALCTGLAVMDLSFGAGARVRTGRPLRSLIPPAFSSHEHENTH